MHRNVLLRAPTLKVGLFQIDKMYLCRFCEQVLLILRKEKFFENSIGWVTKTHNKGTGLGLYICRFIVLKHKGRIAVQDNYPKAVFFEVVIPSLNNKNIKYEQEKKLC